MVNPVGLRFCPTDDEIVDHYLRLKNLGDTSSHFDEVMNTLNICSFDPWDLPLQSRIKSEDQVWYFFSRKENKYERGGRQIRTTKSGYWKITGKPMEIMRKSCSPHKKIGEKRVLMFYLSKNLGEFKTDWVMHEYRSLSSSPAQESTYTFCRVICKDEGWLHNQELQNSCRETQLEDPINTDRLNTAINDLATSGWQNLLNVCNNRET